MFSPSWFRHATTLALAIAACTIMPAPSSAAVRSSVVLSGRVLDESSAPVPQAWILVRGSRRLSALTDSLGGYRITVPGGTVEELAKQAVMIRVQARHRGMSIVTRDGAPELGIEMRVRRDPSSIWRFQVRSNRPPVAAEVAGAALIDPNPRVELQLDFRATPGQQVENLPVPLTATQEVALIGPPPQGPEFARASRTSAPPLRGSDLSVMPDGPPAPLASRARTKEPDLSTAEQRAAKEAKKREREEEKQRQRLEREEKARLAKAARAVSESTSIAAATSRKKTRDRGRNSIFADSRDVPDDGSTTRPSKLTRIEPEIVLSRGPRTEPAVEPPGETAATCSCRVRGTLEVESDRPLSEAMKVDVFIDGLPMHTDTVELFMGSPRTFDLGWIPCGPQAVGFATHSRQRYRLRTFSPITCRPGEVQHVRLVLEPSRGRTAMR